MKKLLLALVFAAIAAICPAQVQNMQAASGATGDLTKPTAGFSLASGQTLNIKTGAIVSGAGSFDFTSSTFKVPNGAAPTTAAFGALAGDNNAWASGRGALQFYDGTANTYVVGVLASDTPTDGQVPVWNTGGTITWETAGGSSGANPTGTIGLSAVNGVSTSFLRADGAPALSQAITPTWSGAHVFSANATLGAASGTTGALTFKGTTSGTVVLSVADAAGSWTMKLPTSAGSNTNVLQTDGSGNTSWVAAGGGGVSGANPTASLGLTAVNGSATTYLRSDGAPALSVGIIPTWTGVHTFTPQVVLTGGASFPGGGAITGSSGAVTIAASGTNQNITLTPTGTGNVTYAAPASANAILALNSAAAPNSPLIYMQTNGSQRATFGAAGATNSGITGSAVGDFFLRSDNQSLLFSSDAGTSISGKFVVSTGQFLLPKGIASTTTGTGTLVVTGGVGISGDTFHGGKVVSVSGTAGVGYATGSGGAVTQGTSRTTGVTLDKVTGAITLFTAVGAPTWTTFTVTNSTVAATDTVIVSPKTGTTDTYIALANTIAAGSFKISFTDLTGTTSEAPILNYAVIKAVAN